MPARLLDQPPQPWGIERRPWPLRVLLLADLPVAERAEWIEDRRLVELRADELGPAWRPWRSYGESPPDAFAHVRTSAVPCTGAELREDLDDAPEPWKCSLAGLAQRPLSRVLAHWPFSLMVVEPAIPPSDASARRAPVGGAGGAFRDSHAPSEAERDDALLAEVARRAGAPIVRAGAARGPWVLSDPARVPPALASFARTGWAGDDDPELALALFAGRIASWARYLFASHEWHPGDVRGGLAASVPPDRFRWIEGHDVVAPPIRNVSFWVTEDIGGYDVEMELGARLGSQFLAGRFPFRIDRG